MAHRPISKLNCSISRYFAYHGTTIANVDSSGMGERKAKFVPFSGNFV